MKKLLTLIAMLMILPMILSATPMSVVGEVFTSTLCVYCPSARAGLRDLAANFDNFIPLIWQNSIGYVEMPSPNYSTRGSMYNVGGIPHARFGGYISEVGVVPGSNMYNYYLPHYNTLNTLDSPLSIDIKMDVSSKSTIDVDADVEVTGNITTSNNKIILLLTYKFNDDYTCAVVAYHDESFELTTVGQTGSYTHSFTYDPDWAIIDLKAVAIVQTFSSNYKIHQAAMCDQNISVDDPGFPEMTIRSYPNPFDEKTTISCCLKTYAQEMENTTIYNIKGEVVRTLDLEPSAIGFSTVWDGKDSSGKAVSNGIYFYRVKAGNLEKTQKLILMK